MRHYLLGKPAIDVFTDADEHTRRESAFGEIIAIGRYSRGTAPAYRLESACMTVERRNDGNQITFSTIFNLTARFHDLAAEFVSRHAGKGCEG